MKNKISFLPCVIFLTCYPKTHIFIDEDITLAKTLFTQEMASPNLPHKDVLKLIKAPTETETKESEISETMSNSKSARKCSELSGDEIQTVQNQADAQRKDNREVQNQIKKLCQPVKETETRK